MVAVCWRRRICEMDELEKILKDAKEIVLSYNSGGGGVGLRYGVEKRYGDTRTFYGTTLRGAVLAYLQKDLQKEKADLTSRLREIEKLLEEV